MNDCDLKLVEAIVNAISDKSWLNYIPTVFASITPMFAIWLSWKFFSDQHIQSAKNRVVEKDVERLYGAADLFFEYSDALNLYFSMVLTKSGYLKVGGTVPDSVEAKTLQATDGVYPKINSIYKSYFFLLSLGADDIALQVSNYRTKTIEFRKKLLDIAKFKSHGVDFSSISDSALIDSITSKREAFIKERDEILKNIAEYKKTLISTSLN